MAFQDICETINKIYSKNKLTIFIIIGVCTGIILASILRAVKSTPYTSRQAMYIGVFGEIFLQLLKAISLPLMSTCLIVAFGSLDKNISGRIGRQMALFFILTKIEASVLGILTAVIINPGSGLKGDTNVTQVLLSSQITLADHFLDMFRNLFPSNLVEMTLRTYTTVLIKPENDTANNIEEWEIKDGGDMKYHVNLLGVVNVAILFGIAIGSVGVAGRPLLYIARSVSEVTFKLTAWILWVSPLLLISLVAGQILRVKKLQEVMSSVGLYLVCIAIGHILQFLIFYPILYILFTRKNPFKFMYDMLDALATSIATASSLASMPVIITCLEEKANCDSRLTRFVIPVGLNINKDGTALTIGVAAVFIAQLHGISLSMGQFFSVLLLSSAGSAAAAAIPSSAMVILIMVLEAVGLPIVDIGLFLAVDFLRDRFTTPTNVWGNCAVTGILNAMNHKQLQNNIETEETHEAENEDEGNKETGVNV